MPTHSLTHPANNSQQSGFEEVEHTADWSLRIWGRDLAELLANAALGMSSLIVSDLSSLPTDVERQVVVDSIDAESLLVDWLSELAYWAEMEGVVFKEFELQAVSSTHLQAASRGGQAPELAKHIKAVTYHNLEIVETETGLEATVVFDV